MWRRAITFIALATTIPTLGRFISRDPLSGAEFSQGTNLYAYCGNNYINLSDPTGQFAIGAIVGLVAGGISGAYGALAQGGNWEDAAIGAAAGGAVGFGLGLIDPTEGLASVTEDVLAGAALGAASGAVGDVAGQVATSVIENPGAPIDINLDSVGANAAGGALL